MVYVLSKNGTPIMPTNNHAKVRLLLKHGKAKVVNRTPFTIQLSKTAVKPLVSARGYKSVPWDTREFTLGENV